MALVPYDDRDGWIWMDGAFTPWREAKVHVLTHGLHYASAVFEGERMYGGEIFKLREHTERLFNSAEILDFAIPFTVAEIDAACLETCARNGLIDCYIRPIAWRGSETIGVSAQDTTIHVAIAAWEWPSYFKPEEKAQGYRPDLGQIPPPFARHRADRVQSGGAVHDLHHLQARGRAGRVRGRHDAGPSRLCRRGHRRKCLLHP